MPRINNSGNTRKSKLISNMLRETPACCTLTLVKHARLPKLIWEPCAGRGAVSRPLILAGHAVIASDLRPYLGADSYIVSGVDFFETEHPPANCDMIVTNPPYDCADNFIRHGLLLGCDVWAFLKLASIQGGGRSDLMDGHCVEVLAGIEMPPMMHRIGWEGPRIKSSGVAFAWYHFATTRRLPCIGIDLRRISWEIPTDD